MGGGGGECHSIVKQLLRVYLELCRFTDPELLGKLLLSLTLSVLFFVVAFGLNSSACCCRLIASSSNEPVHV